MSYQAYLTNIQAKTGKTPAAFRTLAQKKGFTKNGRLEAGVKAGEIVQWLQEDFQLGHGHAMAIYALLKGTKNENSPCALGRKFGDVFRHGRDAPASSLAILPCRVAAVEHSPALQRGVGGCRAIRRVATAEKNQSSLRDESFSDGMESRR